MGWKDAAPVGTRMMSPEQRNLIIMLRERHDGVMPGTYSGEKLPAWSSLEAKREIDNLNARLDKKTPKKMTLYPCPFCGSKSRPCCSKNPVKA